MRVTCSSNETKCGTRPVQARRDGVACVMSAFN